MNLFLVILLIQLFYLKIYWIIEGKIVERKKVNVNISNDELINSTSESVDGSSLSLKSIDDIHSSDSFSSGVLSVGDGISNDSF